jgi:hypothetical protein
VQGRRRGIAGALAALLLGVACSHTTGSAGDGTPVAMPPSAPVIEQAEWRISAHPSGNIGPMSKRELRRVRAESFPLRRAVTEVYDALFLDPAARPAVLNKRFAARAARALPARSGVPASVEKVRTTLRKADIGIDASGARRAAAKVKIRARGIASGERFALLHRGTLWLEKKGGTWKIMAFDVRQKRLR